MSRPPLTCGDRSGFLFAHACDRPPAGACSACGKPICTEHTRMGSTGPTCVTCLRSDQDEDADDADTDGEGSEEDDTPGTRADTDPYFYAGGGQPASYDADDYRAFDATAADEPGESETQTGAS